MAKALSDAQRRALFALPVKGPYGSAGYGWWREMGEIAQIAGHYVPIRTVQILVDRGYAQRHATPMMLVQLTPAGRAHRETLARAKK